MYDMLITTTKDCVHITCWLESSSITKAFQDINCAVLAMLSAAGTMPKLSAFRQFLIFAHFRTTKLAQGFCFDNPLESHST